jgi:hypothetical protein
MSCCPLHWHQSKGKKPYNEILTNNNALKDKITKKL